MIQFVLARSLRHLNKDTPFAAYPDAGLDMAKESQAALEKTFHRVEEALVTDVTHNSIFSSTWGENDPSTLGWLLSLNFDPSIFETLFRYFTNPLLRVTRFEPVLNWGTRREAPKPTAHMLPILRVVQGWRLVEALTKHSPRAELKEFNQQRRAILDLCRGRLDAQLAAHLLPHGEFDAAELIFATEAVLLLGSDPAEIGLELLRQVFAVLGERQKKSAYWRPLRPITQTSRGVVLLPISVEIANSILRIHARVTASRFDAEGAEQRLGLAREYAGWLATRYRTITPSGMGETSGWCSEHISGEDVIHPWETSQVVLFLVDLVEAVRLQTGLRMREGGLFKPETISDSRDTATDREPLSAFLTDDSPIALRPYSVLHEQFIAPRIHNANRSDESGVSMLLSGPPGTGKSSMAKQLALHLGWEMLTITPSDFIADGSEQVEARAKAIFSMLENQRRTVVLLDEIDRLITNRDLNTYNDQGDMFQAMTPSMLVKIGNLRERCRDVVFIIGTNYRERIDPAIARPGRMDFDCVLAPPDQNQRAKTLIASTIKFLESNGAGALAKEVQRDHDARSGEVYDAMQRMAGRCALMVHKELVQEARRVARQVVKGSNRVVDALGNPLEGSASIRLETYGTRFGPELTREQMPLREFWLLVAVTREGVKASKRVWKPHLATQRALRMAMWATTGQWPSKLYAHTFRPMSYLVDRGRLDKMVKKIGKLIGSQRYGPEIQGALEDQALVKES